MLLITGVKKVCNLAIHYKLYELSRREYKQTKLLMHDLCSLGSFSSKRLNNINLICSAL